MALEENRIVLQSADLDTQETYPLFMRIFGVLCIVGSVGVVGNFALGLYELVTQGTSSVSVREYTATTIVIAIVALVAALVLVVMFLLLGVRLLRGLRKRAALLANVMSSLCAVLLVCDFLLWGMDIRLLLPFIAGVILVAVQTYSDPSLAEERVLQRKLRDLEVRQEAEDGTLGLDTTGKGYIKLNFFNLFWIFVIASIAGLAIELVWHMTMVDPGSYQDRAGLLYGPFSPIYGVGAVLMTMALNRIYDRSATLIFLVAGLIGGAFEFFASWFFQNAFGIVAWDYSGTFLSIDGRTNFMFMCMWGLLGLVWVKFATPFLLKVVNIIPWNWRYALTSACAALMVVDVVLTLSAFDCWYQREAGSMDYGHASAITRFCNEHYDNDFMANRFQSMTLDPSSASRAS